MFLFLIRLPILISVMLSYFFVLQWLPIGSLGKKASLWVILGVPGLWWIDLQIDGVRKGYEYRGHRSIVVSTKLTVSPALWPNITRHDFRNLDLLLHLRTRHRLTLCISPRSSTQYSQLHTPQLVSSNPCPYFTQYFALSNIRNMIHRLAPN